MPRDELRLRHMLDAARKVDLPGLVDSLETMLGTQP